jgi:hypothetical protein
MRAIRIAVAVALLAVAGAGAAPGEPAAPPKYRVAFASFAPLDLDVYLADADGSSAWPPPLTTGRRGYGTRGKWGTLLLNGLVKATCATSVPIGLSPSFRRPSRLRRLGVRPVSVEADGRVRAGLGLPGRSKATPVAVP